MCDSIWSHYHHLEQSLRMRRVTWPITGKGGGKNDPHFWNPWSQFTYSLCHFQGATTKIKLCYMRKIAFIPLWKLQSSLRMRSRPITWPVHRGPRKPHVTIFDPNFSIHYTTFMVLPLRLRVGLYWSSISMLKRFSAATKQSPVKIGSQNSGFSEI